MDKDLAEAYIGKQLLIGITYLAHDDTFLEQKQFHGRIVRINESEGIVIELADSDKEFKLPPMLDSLREAPEGEYRLRETGEVVVNPDLLTTWTLHKPPSEAA